MRRSVAAALAYVVFALTCCISTPAGTPQTYRQDEPEERPVGR